MNVPQTELDAAARALATANGRLIRAVVAGNQNRAEAAAIAAEEGRALVSTTLNALVRLGAASPYPAAPMASASSAPPLHLMDTPANRRLFDALMVAYEAAAAVDRERGDDPADGFAAILEGFAAGKRDEVLGAVGAGRE